MRELAGTILGYIIVVVGAWFAALSLMAYSMASLNPLNWTTPERVLHLVIQWVIIGLYALWVKPWRR